MNLGNQILLGSQILGVISPAMALLVMLGTFALLIVGLMASGIVSVHVEVEEKEEKPAKEKEKLAEEAEIVEEAAGEGESGADEGWQE